jgi:uncharacterized membrane protein YfcA
MNALALLGAVAFGLALGLTGAGGSILTVPVLVFLAEIPPRQAVGLSLLIVGAAAAAGAARSAMAGELHLRAAGMFALAGMPAAVLGAAFTHLVSPTVLMGGFATLMALVGVSLVRPRRAGPVPTPECRPLRCLLAGAGVGLLTGFLGVGGGFLLVPALLKFARLPIRMAAGTSLAVIAANSVAGFFSHLGETPVPWLLAGVFTAIAVTGVLVGGTIASRLPEAALRRGFGVLVLVVAAVVFLKI